MYNVALMQKLQPACNVQRDLMTQAWRALAASASASYQLAVGLTCTSAHGCTNLRLQDIVHNSL